MKSGPGEVMTIGNMLIHVRVTAVAHNGSVNISSEFKKHKQQRETGSDVQSCALTLISSERFTN